MPEVDDTLGDRYVLVDRIGQGGMGEIWRATDTLLERVVAVKVLLPALAGDSASAGRFLAEARTMATVSHPAIVEVYDYGRSDALAYLVMQFVDGDSLRQVLDREERLAADRTMVIVAQAATALHIAHGRGIVHRDVKPGNLLIRPDGQVVLTDFGIATLVNRARLTAADSVLGTRRTWRRSSWPGRRPRPPPTCTRWGSSRTSASPAGARSSPARRTRSR